MLLLGRSSTEAIVPQPRVSFIGLGLMGRPMGHNLLKAGFPLVVWNRTARRADSLVAAGARLAASPKEAAAAADILITIVSDPPALEEVLWGSGSNSDDQSGGAFAALKKGAIYIDSSTVSPTLARKIADAAKAAGIRFLDAPVTGGTWGAEKGELLFMIGGQEDTLEAARPVLSAMGKKLFHLGPNGAGQTIKLAMNLLLALQVDAFAEALALVTGAGLAGEKLVEVMQASMARSGVLDVKAPVMLSGDYQPSFPLRLMHKDLSLALELGNQLGIPLPATAAAREIYNSVKGSCKDDLDYAAVFKYWKK
jgi:3-hydroxyisobutyrate dehydrogenase-like beta-hydroxyacid dehydrogenase